MNNKIGIGALIVFFVGVITVFALLPEIASNVRVMSDTIDVINESIDLSVARLTGSGINESYPFTLSNAPTGYLQTDCPITGFSITNGSATVSGTSSQNFTLTASTGTFTLNNTLFNNQSGLVNTSYASYTYCDEGYISSGAGRTVSRLILTFAALGLLGFVIWGAYEKLRGII